MNNVTIGWMRSDGDMDVLCTFNFRNAREIDPQVCAGLERAVELLKSNNTNNLTILEREDMPDVLDLTS